MKETCLAPGPTKVHPEIEQWLKDALAEGVLWRSHRSPWFGDLYGRVKAGLRELLGIPETHEIAFLSSANEAWERSIQCLVRTESFHLVGGEFAERWVAFAERLGRKPRSFVYDWTFEGDFSAIDVPAGSEAICVTQNETSIGLWIPESQIVDLAARYPDKLMLMDVVSGIPMTRVPWQCVDLVYWSVQKGFCLPAGLSVVVFSPRVVERSREIGLSQATSAFHSFDLLAEESAKLLTTETPNILGIYLLSRATEKYLGIGVDVIRAETARRSERLYGLLEGELLSPLVSDLRYRSQTVAAIRTASSAETLRSRLSKEQGVYVGPCYGGLKDVCLRVANFPSHTDVDHDRFFSACAQLGSLARP